MCQAMPPVDQQKIPNNVLYQELWEKYLVTLQLPLLAELILGAKT